MSDPDTWRRTIPFRVRPVRDTDFDAWKPLWDGYNAFYGRRDDTALPAQITHIAWQRFLDPNEPMFALVAEAEGALVGLVHYLFHRSTTRIELTCYLQDLFTAPSSRGSGVGRALIEAEMPEALDPVVRTRPWTHPPRARPPDSTPPPAHPTHRPLRARAHREPRCTSAPTTPSATPHSTTVTSSSPASTTSPGRPGPRRPPEISSRLAVAASDVLTRGEKRRNNRKHSQKRS